jgi:hypothetical protein
MVHLLGVYREHIPGTVRSGDAQVRRDASTIIICFSLLYCLIGDLIRHFFASSFLKQTTSAVGLVLIRSRILSHYGVHQAYDLLVCVATLRVASLLLT